MDTKNENFLIKKLPQPIQKAIETITNFIKKQLQPLAILIITIGTAIVIIAIGTPIVYFMWKTLNYLQIDQIYPIKDINILMVYLNLLIVFLVSISILMFFIIYKNTQKQIIKEKFILFRTSSFMILAVMALLFVKLAPGVFHANNLGDIISLFALMLAFISGVNYLLYELNKRDIDAKTKDIKEELQNYAGAKTRFMTAFALWTHYYCHCIEVKNKNTHLKLLDQAIIEARNSLYDAKNLDNANYGEFLYKCKNNLAFFLAILPDPNNEKEARDNAEYIYKIAMDKNKTVNFKSTYFGKATWALVLWRFYEKDKRAKEKAYYIIKELLNDAMIDKKILKRDLKDVWKFIGGKTFEEIILSLKPEREKQEDFDKIIEIIKSLEEPEKI